MNEEKIEIKRDTREREREKLDEKILVEREVTTLRERETV